MHSETFVLSRRAALNYPWLTEKRMGLTLGALLVGVVNIGLIGYSGESYLGMFNVLSKYGKDIFNTAQEITLSVISTLLETVPLNALVSISAYNSAQKLAQKLLIEKLPPELAAELTPVITNVAIWTVRIAGLFSWSGMIKATGNVLDAIIKPFADQMPAAAVNSLYGFMYLMAFITTALFNCEFALPGVYRALKYAIAYGYIGSEEARQTAQTDLSVDELLSDLAKVTPQEREQLLEHSPDAVFLRAGVETVNNAVAVVVETATEDTLLLPAQQSSSIQASERSSSYQPGFWRSLSSCFGACNVTADDLSNVGSPVSRPV